MVAAVAGEDFALADVAAACERPDDLVAGRLEAAVGGGLVDEGATLERSPARCAWHAARALLAVAQGDSGSARVELERGVAELAVAPLDAHGLYATSSLGAVAARLGPRGRGVGGLPTAAALRAPHGDGRARVLLRRVGVAGPRAAGGDAGEPR